MLKLYNKATAMQRLLAFIIDGLILGLFVAGISALIFIAIGFNYNAFSAARSEFLTNYMLYVVYQGGYRESYILALNEYNNFSKIFYLVVDSVFLIGILLYLVLLPRFWDKQTVGRMIAKVRVINHAGEINPSLKRILVREIIGTWLFYVLSYTFISVVVILISGIIILISGRSVVDRISGTDLVQELPVTVNSDAFQTVHKFDEDVPREFRPDPSEFRKDDSIDAEVKDLDNNENDKDDSNNDDEYQLF